MTSNTFGQIEALSFCAPVINEWVESAGIKIEPVDLEYLGSINPRFIRRSVGEYLGLSSDWSIVLASFGEMTDACFRRFILIDDNLVSSPEWCNQLREGLKLFGGAPITVVNISRTPPSNLAQVFDGSLDFEFNPLQETREDFYDRLKLHFAAQQKSFEWRKMTFRRMFLYVVGTFCLLPGFGQLFGDLIFALFEPDSKWNRFYAGYSLVVCCATLTLVLAFCYRRLAPTKTVDGQQIISKRIELKFAELILLRLVIALLAFGYLFIAAAWFGFLR